jgi:hypothetical protein
MIIESSKLVLYGVLGVSALRISIVNLFQKQDFLDKIAKQIFQLIGQEPQYLLDDQVTIFYS